MPQSSLFLDTIVSKPTSEIPIWFMRQAGRYLPEYQKTRKQAGSFLNLCYNPDLATQVTLQPIQRFSFDASIIFSDILLVPQALGMELDFIEGVGPVFANPITTSNDINRLKLDNLSDNLNNVYQAIQQTKSELPKNVPLIGFVGSPLTLLTYLCEGKSSKNHLKAKDLIYNRKTDANSLLDKLTTAVSQHLISQVKAGCDVLMIFDSFGGILTQDAYLEFSLKYIKQIINNIRSTSEINSNIPIITFTKGGGLWLDYIKTTGTDVIGIDWMTDIGYAKNIVKNAVTLQGNMDPSILATGDKSTIKTEVSRIINSYKAANNDNISNYIFNLGHGILPTTPPDSVKYLIDIVKSSK